jgi:hypothetical protein
MQEAKQAVELIGKWEMIDVADALELLSPDFESDEVCCLTPLSMHVSGFLFFRASLETKIPFGIEGDWRGN